MDRPRRRSAVRSLSTVVEIGEEVRFWPSGTAWSQLAHKLTLGDVLARFHNHKNRAYPLHKIQENNTAEIMNVVLEDARESYAPEIVVELRSERPEDVEENIGRLVAWVEAWKRDNA